MKTKHKTERGQVLILIVFGIIGLIGITALSIDGGNAYLDRRRAQNAADTAALSAGLAKIRQPANTSPADAWKASGYTRATSNGFPQNGPTTTVVVYACTEADAHCTLPPGTEPKDYVKVSITSLVHTWFAPLVGITQVTNRVDAIAKAVKPEKEPLYNGNALVSLQPGCSPNDPFFVNGNAEINVTGSGIFVNSSCSTAYTQGGSSTVTTETGTCVVGGAKSTDTTPPPNHNCAQVDLSRYTLPNPVCNGAGKVTAVGKKEYVATPGTYNGPFPGVSQAGSLKLMKGIYCLNGGMDIHSQWSMTTDLNGNGYDSSEGVLFFVPHGDITINGGTELNLHAITCHNCGLDEALVGYLFYVPPDNPAVIKINGGSGSTFTGTILAPTSEINYEGGSDSTSFNSQIISSTFKVIGNATLNISYVGSENAQGIPNPALYLFK